MDTLAAKKIAAFVASEPAALAVAMETESLIMQRINELNNQISSAMDDYKRCAESVIVRAQRASTWFEGVVAADANVVGMEHEFVENETRRLTKAASKLEALIASRNELQMLAAHFGNEYCEKCGEDLRGCFCSADRQG